MIVRKRYSPFEITHGPPSEYQDPEGILMKDREGRLWISTYESGLYAQQKQFGHFKKHPVQGDLQDILQNTDHIYACSAEGNLEIIDPVTNHALYSLSITNQGQKTDPFKLHIDNKDRLWILSRRALHSLSADNTSTIAWNTEFFEKESKNYNYFWT